MYKGPESLPKLTCARCGETLTCNEKELRVTSAPSENWEEVIGLWQCHNEKFDQYFDPVTKQLAVPNNVMLHSLNTVQVKSAIINSQVVN